MAVMHLRLLPARLLPGVLLMALVAAASYARAEDLTITRHRRGRDYVFGCMKANGETQEILQKCSCSIELNRLDHPL